MAYRLQIVFGPPSTWSSINPVAIASTGACPNGYALQP